MTIRTMPRCAEAESRWNEEERSITNSPSAVRERRRGAAGSEVGARGGDYVEAGAAAVGACHGGAEKAEAIVCQDLAGRVQPQFQPPAGGRVVLGRYDVARLHGGRAIRLVNPESPGVPVI